MPSNKLVILVVYLLAHTLLPVFGQIDALLDSAMYYKWSDYSKSIHYWDLLIKQDPSTSRYYYEKARLEEAIHKVEDAINTLGLLVSRSPNETAAHLSRGIWFKSIRKYDSALICLSKVTGKSVKYDSIAFRERAITYSALGHYKEAMADFEIADRYGGFIDSEYLLGRILAEIGVEKLNEAMFDLEHLLTLTRDSLTFVKLRVQIHIIRNEHASVVADVSWILAKEKNAALLTTRGQAFLGMKEFKKAIDDFNAAAKLKVEIPELYLHRGLAHYYLANDKEAIEDMNQAAKIFPSDPVIYVIRAECKNNLKPGSGCEDIRKAISLGAQIENALADEFCK